MNVTKVKITYHSHINADDEMRAKCVNNKQVEGRHYLLNLLKYAINN